MVKTVQYGDFPALCDQLLDEVELTGVTVEVIRNGRPYADGASERQH